MTGGVIGHSFVGDPLLPESSVSPGPEYIASDALLVLLSAADKECEGAELVGLSLAEKRERESAVVRAEGADWRLLSDDGGE